MPLKSSPQRWGAGASTLHWLMAAGILGMGGFGLYMADLPNSPDKIRIYAVHKSIGLTLLALGLLRLLWRVADRRPEELPMPSWQARSARAVHIALYILIFTLPLSGWLYNSASGYPLQWFWTLQLPSLTGGANPTLKPIAHFIHEYGFFTLAALVAAHAGAALHHHFVLRDTTLTRMLPGLPQRAPQPSPDALPNHTDSSSTTKEDNS